MEMARHNLLRVLAADGRKTVPRRERAILLFSAATVCGCLEASGTFNGAVSDNVEHTTA
jgi:hypothetical protein